MPSKWEQGPTSGADAGKSNGAERAGSTRATSEAVLCRSARASRPAIKPDHGVQPQNQGAFDITKIALTAAAILVATGAAFASSENYGSNNANQPTVAVDRTVTASITKSDADVQKPLPHGADRNLFGNH